MSGLVKIERALLSAWRKEEVVPFGRFLVSSGAEVLSTGGTARALREAGVPVRDVSEVTGFPEMMDGRVKTLHPRVHGGLLFRRDSAEHARTAEEHQIPRIDLVLVDLYPFADAVARPGASRDEIVEMIDIGGPAMVRSAAKNHDHVLVVVDPADLASVREDLSKHGLASPIELRRRMAAKAFRRTAAYDALIAEWLGDEKFPERLTLTFELREVARYGENPHQEGAVYVGPRGKGGIARAAKLSGKDLSYNNFLDASAALDLVTLLDRFGAPAAAIIKHRNPCGAALDAAGIVPAFAKAYEGDPLSAFGGILAVNRPVAADLAQQIAEPSKFFEVIVAPRFDPGAVAVLTGSTRWGKNVRLLQMGGGESLPAPEPGLEVRSIGGGLLVQDRDLAADEEFRCVTDRAPTETELDDLRFAAEVCRHVISNGIALAKGRKLLGCGAGQMSRVDSVEIATHKAGEGARGAVLASDAFFPFADGVLAAARAGVTAVVQPGGSVRDAEVIAACNQHGVAMVLTGRRHFRH